MSNDKCTFRKEFPHPALNLGVMQPGELRCLRLVLRNRGTYGMAIRVDMSGAAANLALSFTEQPMPPGVPRVMDVDACFQQPGEYTGEIRVRTSSLEQTTLMLAGEWGFHSFTTEWIIPVSCLLAMEVT